MSYYRTTGALTDLVPTGIGNAAQAVKIIVEDPALPKLVQHVIRLNELEKSDTGPTTKGLGLDKVEPYVAMYVRVRERPWTGVVAAGALLAVPFLIGYGIGKTR
jgi:hypothetical protein